MLRHPNREGPELDDGLDDDGLDKVSIEHDTAVVGRLETKTLRARRYLDMTKRQIVSEDLLAPTGHFSHATTIAARGTMVFVSGLTARRPDGTVAGIGDITAQTRQVCENLRAVMAAAGGTLDDICRVDVYVRNMEHFSLIHDVRRQYFTPPLPASTMVEVTKMTSPEYLIEISAIALLDDRLESAGAHDATDV